MSDDIDDLLVDLGEEVEEHARAIAALQQQQDGRAPRRRPARRPRQIARASQRTVPPPRTRRLPETWGPPPWWHLGRLPPARRAQVEAALRAWVGWLIGDYGLGDALDGWQAHTAVRHELHALWLGWLAAYAEPVRWHESLERALARIEAWGARASQQRGLAGMP
jgi:hypothetical protein